MRRLFSKKRSVGGSPSETLERHPYSGAEICGMFYREASLAQIREKVEHRLRDDGWRLVE